MAQRIPEPDELLRPRRKWSIWTILAPLALVVVVILMGMALGKSNSTSSDEKTTTTTKAVVKTPTKKVAIYKVRKGDSAGGIAARFDMTQQQLVACNPRTLQDAYSIQPGDRLHVNKAFCKQRAKDLEAKLAKLEKGSKTGGTTSTDTTGQ